MKGNRSSNFLSSPLAVFQRSSHAPITPNFSDDTCYGRVERHAHGSSLSFCRLYSDYLYFGIANKSAEDFHEKVSESLQLFEGCLTEYTMRSCVYNTTVNNAMPVSAHTPAPAECWTRKQKRVLANGKEDTERSIKDRWSGTRHFISTC